ncbi:hypothetical protein ACL58G_07885 [Massilia sp. GER05]|uniref:hypothetical protein n=1 Tax=Massilia sp. GER05 TaxID=3394605 RepID=UPI003F84A580
MTTDALDKFNDVLEALSIQNLAVYASVDTVVPLVANQAVYILGPAGTGQRPLSMNSIDSARVTYGGVDFQVEIVSDVEYDALAVKQTTGVPKWAALDNDYPNATISLWPVPYQASALTLSQRQKFTAASTLADTFDMPPGYKRLIRLMLAWELRTDYPGMSPQELQNLKDDLTGALASVKRANIEPVLMRSEVAELDASGGGAFANWRDGV